MPGGPSPSPRRGRTIWSHFTDRYPVLVLSTASVDALNERLETPVGAERFRPNIVVSGVGPHAEDGWARIRVGGVEGWTW